MIRQKKNETIAKIIKHLNEEEFNKFWGEGKNLTLEEAVEIAVNNG